MMTTKILEEKKEGTEIELDPETYLAVTKLLGTEDRQVIQEWIEETIRDMYEAETQAETDSQ